MGHQRCFVLNPRFSDNTLHTVIFVEHLVFTFILVSELSNTIQSEVIATIVNNNKITHIADIVRKYTQVANNVRITALWPLLA